MRRLMLPGNCCFWAHKTAPSSAVLRKNGTSKRHPAAHLSEKGERSCFCCPIHRAGRSVWTMIRVHCSAFTSRFSKIYWTVFIIAPQKNRVNPKPCIYSNFICRLQSLYMFRTAEAKRPLRRCGASERAFCLDIALVWGGIMLLGNRLRPRFPWQKYNSFHIWFR